MLFLKKALSQSLTKEQQKNPQQIIPILTKKTMATLRLQKDFQQINDLKLEGIILSFPEQNSIQTIDVFIRSSGLSPYKGTQIQFRLTFPNQYPIEAPKLRCLQKIYHPNINIKGTVCLPLLREDYGPTISLRTILCGLYFLLMEPSPQDALNPDIGDCMENMNLFRRIVLQTSTGSVYLGQKYDNIRINFNEEQMQGQY